MHIYFIMVNTGETFRKSERLCSKKVIEALFDNGKKFFCSPFLIVWSYNNSEALSPVQVAFSVPKKEFKLAVTRNLIKRRMREAYRKNKMVLYDYLNASEKKIVLTIIYREKSVLDYITVENTVKQMIKMLIRTLDESKPKC
jgi:ribonuclease P protein component